MAFGIIAIIIMLCTMDMDYTDIWRYLLKVGKLVRKIYIR